jgi:hypothetical protein
MAPTRKVDVRSARVLHVDGPVLIFEFEVPEKGFILPADDTQVQVQFDDASTCRARVLGKESSRPGPHQEGLTVRLAVKLSRRKSWRGREVSLRWEGRVQPPDADPEDLAVHVRILLGERP